MTETKFDDAVPVSEAELASLAASFTAQLVFPAIVYLSGELGAGKSTFARGMLRSLNVEGPIKSPTFTLVESYEVAGKCFSHLDLYRLSDSDELEFLGFRDICESSDLLIVEWPEMAADVLPSPSHHIRLDYASRRSEDALIRRVKIVTL